jgi:hypothetical protein
VRLDKSLVAELKELTDDFEQELADYADYERDRERLLSAVLMGDPHEARANWMVAWTVNEEWGARIRRNLKQARKA